LDCSIRQRVASKKKQSQATQVSQSNATVHNSKRRLRLRLPASNLVVAHVELVFAGLDEDKASAFRCRLPDL
jgi:hypothetical protein